MSRPTALSTTWTTALLVAATLTASPGCGERLNCWCRCPSGNSVEYTSTTNDGGTCADLCSDYGCWYEDPNGCTPETVRDCECDGGLVGNQACRGDGSWGECLNCIAPPICTPGDREACTCPGTGAEGVRFCEIGDWGPCEGCDSECAPGASRGCTCDGDLRGQQTCVDGYWSTCSDCAEPPLCEDGDTDICACDSGTTGVQQCVSGAWGPCEQCATAGQVYADIDFGVEGVVVSGQWLDVFDTTEWGCSAMPPGEDNLIWRIFPDDGTHPETLTLEFELPATVASVDIDYWHMSMANDDGTARSSMTVVINGVTQSPAIAPTSGCVELAEHVDYAIEAFAPGATNRIELWSNGGGFELNHGLQGVWIDYTYYE